MDAMMNFDEASAKGLLRGLTPKDVFGGKDCMERCFDYVTGADKSIPLPTRGSKYSAGYDFTAPRDIFVPARGCSELVFFGVKAYMTRREYLGITIRSSLAVKYAHLQVAQGEAIIDADYADNAQNEGNIGIMFINNGDTDYTIKKGERCCQGIFKRYAITDDDDCTDERKGGYGSTGA